MTDVDLQFDVCQETYAKCDSATLILYRGISSVRYVKSAKINQESIQVNFIRWNQSS